MSYLHCPTCQRAYNLTTQPTCPRCAASARVAMASASSVATALPHTIRASGSIDPGATELVHVGLRTGATASNSNAAPSASTPTSTRSAVDPGVDTSAHAASAADAIVAALDQLARAMESASADDIGRAYAELERRALFALPEPPPRVEPTTAIVRTPQPIATRRPPLRKRLQAWARARVEARAPTLSLARAHLARFQRASSTLARALR